MKKGNSIKITSNLHKELCSKITINDKKFLIVTEYLGSESKIINTKIYVDGKIVYSKDTKYKDLPKNSVSDKNLIEFMKAQHDAVIDLLKVKHTEKRKTPSEYLEEVKIYLKRKDFKKAIHLLTISLKDYPDEPFLLSYYGCLEAVLNADHSYGIQICLKAFEKLNERMPFGQEFFYPTLYLNLGRAYLASGNKKKAAEAFQKGLIYDNDNKDLIQEIKKLGIRRKPAISFLPRTNPINKYIGIILHKLKLLTFINLAFKS